MTLKHLSIKSQLRKLSVQLYNGALAHWPQCVTEVKCNIAVPNTKLVTGHLNLDRGSAVCKTPVPVPEIFSVMGALSINTPQLQGTTFLLCGGTEVCCPSPVQNLPSKPPLCLQYWGGFGHHFTPRFRISAHKLIDDFTELCKRVCNWGF